MKETANHSSTAVKSGKFFTVRNMAFIAVMAALICVAAPFTVPMPGLVPISLATFAIYLAGGILGAKKGTLAVLIYVLIGAVGLPVFSGAKGGFEALFGVTGGYIIGYIPCALLSGLFVDLFFKSGIIKRLGDKKGIGKAIGWIGAVWAVPVGMILGTVVLYAFGTAWFVVARGVTLEVALASCVIPFLLGDAIKIVCASAVTIALRDRLSRIMAGQ